MSEMTPALLEHLTAEERGAWKFAQEATPGPWHHPEDLPTLVERRTSKTIRTVCGCGQGGIQDAAFIAASRTALPAALLALAEARKELAEQRQINDSLRGGIEMANNAAKRRGEERDEARRALREVHSLLTSALAGPGSEDTANLVSACSLIEELDAAAHAAKEGM